MDKETRSENEFLKETAPLLFEKKIEVDAAPPEGYFDSLPAKMSARIASEFSGNGEERKAKEKPKGLLRYINFGNIAAAAAVALIIALVPAIRNLTQTPAADHFFAEALTAEEAEAYFDWFGDEDELYELLRSESEIDLFAELSFTDYMTDDDIENYLIREGVSTEEIADLMSENIYDY